MTLGDVLVKHFGCKKPFLAKPKICIDEQGEHYQPFTAAGVKAYEKLVELIYDLEELGVISGSGKAVMLLDEMLNEPEGEKNDNTD